MKNIKNITDVFTNLRIACLFVFVENVISIFPSSHQNWSKNITFKAIRKVEDKNTTFYRKASALIFDSLNMSILQKTPTPRFQRLCYSVRIVMNLSYKE